MRHLPEANEKREIKEKSRTLSEFVMTDETGLTKSFRMSNITLNQPYLLVLHWPICFSACSSTISLNIMSRRTEMDFTSHILFHLGSHTILQNFLVAAAASVSNVLLRIYFLVFFFLVFAAVIFSFLSSEMPG